MRFSTQRVTEGTIVTHKNIIYTCYVPPSLSLARAEGGRMAEHRQLARQASVFVMPSKATKLFQKNTRKKQSTLVCTGRAYIA